MAAGGPRKFVLDNSSRFVDASRDEVAAAALAEFGLGRTGTLPEHCRGSDGHNVVDVYVLVDARASLDSMLAD